MHFFSPSEIQQQRQAVSTDFRVKVMLRVRGRIMLPEYTAIQPHSYKTQKQTRHFFVLVVKSRVGYRFVYPHFSGAFLGSS